MDEIYETKLNLFRKMHNKRSLSVGVYMLFWLASGRLYNGSDGKEWFGEATCITHRTPVKLLFIKFYSTIIVMKRILNSNYTIFFFLLSHVKRPFSHCYL